MAVETLHHVEHAAQHAGEAGAAAHSGLPELPNFISVLSARFHDYPLVASLHHWEDLVFSALVGLCLCAIAWRFAHHPSLIPRGGQNLLELIVESIDRFVCGIIGRAGRQHTPFIGTLFLYIWCMNLSGLVPGMKSSTSNINTTIALAAVVFCYVQAWRVRTLGLWAYLHHMAGSPSFDDITTAPLWLKPVLILIKVFVMIVLFVLELIGELVKPASLCARLLFNITSEDVLLAVLVGLGVGAGAALHSPVGIPIQAAVFPLILIFSTVQALVFSLLSAVYIALIVPHNEHHALAHDAPSHGMH